MAKKRKRKSDLHIQEDSSSKLKTKWYQRIIKINEVKRPIDLVRKYRIAVDRVLATLKSCSNKMENAYWWRKGRLASQFGVPSEPPR